jgi:hypothetical protein
VSSVASRDGNRKLRSVSRHAMWVLTIQTGLRISELTGLTCGDITLGVGAHVHCIGKGRKQRRTPLVPLSVEVLDTWLVERGGTPTQPLFPTSTGRRLSRDAIERRLTHHIATAAQHSPSLNSKHITAHTLRHTAAMRLLTSGVDITVIALWLGHEQISTTNIYLHADMTQKERAIARVTAPNTTPSRYKPTDPLLAFLEARPPPHGSVAPNQRRGGPKRRRVAAPALERHAEAEHLLAPDRDARRGANRRARRNLREARRAPVASFRELARNC